MPEITVTETQREQLAAIEAELDTAYIDTYGCIRMQDVVQYLLDTYTPPEQRGGDKAAERIATAGFQTLQAIAADVEGVPGSGISKETMRGELLSTLGPEEFAARLAEVTDTGDAGTETTVGDTESEVESAGAATESGEDTTTASGDDTATESGEDTAATGLNTNTDGPGSVLSAANQLLDDNADKWREGGSDEPYEVDLPDGTTETVRTKDDVRGLLFKHY